ncbi:hypothetical protein KOR42_23240 [Thalassoglobus neptunius]|uniref:Uncharacterized protein n=1 Tax=Thalassoglobus neptunius TaxID=1938619 RepID=A0A5C5X739_9PLAN|nr:hypothetical protein [Thalassoglobus neptunius]TWT58937.1 hypothetical protein KOR42_23240 [Thalassoglobus neptunius]
MSKRNEFKLTADQIQDLRVIEHMAERGMQALGREIDIRNQTGESMDSPRTDSLIQGLVDIGIALTKLREDILAEITMEEPVAVEVSRLVFPSEN